MRPLRRVVRAENLGAEDGVWARFQVFLECGHTAQRTTSDPAKFVGVRCAKCPPEPEFEQPPWEEDKP